MHCDDKRTLYVLKGEIEKKWDLLRYVNFSDEHLINDLRAAIQDYFEYKKSAK